MISDQANICTESSNTLTLPNTHHLNDYTLITSDEIVEIDGSFLEGGGQILRISIFLSILFNKKLRIYNIRGKRSNPGLQRQHLAATEAITSLTGSKVEGAKIGSTEIIITPGSVNNIPLSRTKCDCNSAGSIGLLIQQILPCIIYASGEVNIELVGGTIVSHAPPTLYLEDVLIHILKDKMGVEFNLNVKRHGLFPTGGGIVDFSSTPVKYIQPINLTERGALKHVKVKLASTTNFHKFKPEQTMKEILKSVKKELKKYYPDNDEDKSLEEILSSDYIKLYSPKKAYTIFASIILTFENTIVSCEQLYSEKKETYDEIVNFASELSDKLENLLHQDYICFDEFTVDHLIIFMALAKGKSKIILGEVSMHTLTALEIVRKFVPGIVIVTTNGVENGKSQTVIEIEGIGWHNEN